MQNNYIYLYFNMISLVRLRKRVSNFPRIKYPPEVLSISVYQNKTIRIGIS